MTVKVKPLLLWWFSAGKCWIVWVNRQMYFSLQHKNWMFQVLHASFSALQINLFSPLTMIKCWLLMFVQTTDRLIFKHVTDYTSCWHFRNRNVSKSCSHCRIICRSFKPKHCLFLILTTWFSKKSFNISILCRKLLFQHLFWRYGWSVARVSKSQILRKILYPMRCQWQCFSPPCAGCENSRVSPNYVIHSNSLLNHVAELFIL